MVAIERGSGDHRPRRPDRRRDDPAGDGSASTRVVKGPQSATVVVEQEASLLDGTPITVNGVSPLVVGDRGWFFLIDGDGEQFPYTALTTVDGFVADGTRDACAAAATVAAGRRARDQSPEP